MPGLFKIFLVQGDVVGNPTDMRLVGVGHHGDTHPAAPYLSLDLMNFLGPMVSQARWPVKVGYNYYVKMFNFNLRPLWVI
jgi:hypothetical protein